MTGWGVGGRDSIVSAMMARGLGEIDIVCVAGAAVGMGLAGGCATVVLTVTKAVGVALSWEVVLRVGFVEVGSVGVWH